MRFAPELSMIFTGLSLPQVLGLFGVAAALTTALYVLKLRRRAVAVPFSKLWDKVLRDKDATTLFSRLKRLLSLAVQLGLLALLAAALGDPRRAASLSTGRNVVVLVDASASMQATDVGTSRLQAAKDEAKALVRGLGGADRVLVARMDAAVTPLGPMTSDTSELERAIDAVEPTDARADFPRALRFATDSLRGLERPEIVVISDGRLGEAVDGAGEVRLGDDVKLTYVPIGQSARNVGITQFSVRRYPLDRGRYEVMLEVTNTGASPEDVELSLLGDGALVDIAHLRIGPGERLPRFYPNLSGANRTLEAKLALHGGERDALPVDDHAYALLPERRRAKVLVVTEGNTYLEAALLLDEYLDVSYATPEAYAKSEGGLAQKPDVIIFDGATPTRPPRAHAIYIDPRGPGSPVKVEGELDHPGFDKIDRKHPIVRWTALDDVNIARGHKLVPGPGDKVVGASDEGPILIAGQRDGFGFVALGFDVRASDLALRVAWPVLLLNSINAFTDEDARYVSGLRTGEVWRVPVASKTGQARLSLPVGGEVIVPVHEGRAVYLGTRAGFYALREGEATPTAKSAGDQGPALGETAFAANLTDGDESAIEPAKELIVAGKRAGPLEGFQIGLRSEVWIYLLLAVIGITAIEWFTYHRRITV